MKREIYFGAVTNNISLSSVLFLSVCKMGSFRVFEKDCFAYDFKSSNDINVKNRNLGDILS